MTSHNFRHQIQAAIADGKLQAALDKNAAQRLVAREQAYANLPESFEALKRRAHAVRAEVIANHDRYLEQFIAQAQENGLIIHKAANAAEARDIILELAKEKKARLISKSKTMLSEEIELNPALEALGIEVVETDLGEYIVQLRDEHPSHIITPAVHLRREDVGETFHEKLGLPLTDDIQILTNTARARLRQSFLDTDIGISGVNFGVADTGALCIVTNEGNGRMVTTLPKTHIALMGIERLVPDWNGLALVLTMLPRSATGQKATVYTQLISKPRPADELDGAEERHLVLVDNGRSRLRGSPLQETLYCIRCGACINACPVFREIGGFSYTSIDGTYTPYPGPIGSALSPGLFGQADFGHLAQASSLCGACKEACPMDIDLPKMLLRVRGGGLKLDKGQKERRVPEGMTNTISWGLGLFTWISTKPGLFAIAQKFAALLGRIWSPRADWMFLPALTGWGYSKDFPRPAGKTFRERWKETKGQQGSGSGQKYGELEKTAGGASLEETNQVGTTDPAEPHQPVTRFERELTALNGHFIPCTEDDLAQEIASLLKEKSIPEIMSWQAAHLPEGLVEELQGAGISLHHGSHPEIQAGLTGSTAAVAETGSLLLTSGPGRPSSTSLLPEIHLAIIDETQIYENLLQVLQLQEVREAASSVLISGPSRTADIEMTLTIGVHGPGELYVFCVR